MAKEIRMIAAVASDLGIGKDGKLLFHIKEDMAWFRSHTLHNVVVMGRKTLESFPNSKPLKNRTNIVLTHNKDYKVEGAVVVHSLDELHEELKKYPTDDIYICGGQKIYEQLLDECDTAHITKIDFEYDADAYFPNLDADPRWQITADSEEQTYFDLEYVFVIYDRR